MRVGARRQLSERRLAWRGAAAMTGEANGHDPSAVVPGRRWFVVQSQPRKELYASANLENQGFPTFTPRLRRTVRHARRLKAVQVALFPRYLFISLDLSRDRWRSVNGTFGVSRVVTDGSMPAPVPSGLVEGLIAAANGDGVIAFSAPLVPGEQVRLLEGPFADQIGHLVALDDAGRARVLLEILGAEREVRVSSSVLAPVTDGGLRR